jgi:hypothetical protein
MMRNGNTSLLERPDNAATTNRPTPQTLAPGIAKQIDVAVSDGINELITEGTERNQITGTHIMPAAELCPSQGQRAATGFHELCN